MPLPEFFHQLYILKRVPRAIVSAMAAAINDGRAASPDMQRAFAPYVSSESRRRHRKEMQLLDLTRRFDYNKEMTDWISEYQANLDAHRERLMSMRRAIAV
jgi:ABC-type Fe3+-hydroxamate transport system substrate-binding protein